MTVNDPRDQGLGVSVAVYAAVMAGALALIVVPVLWASSGTAQQIPELPKYDITSSRPLTDQQRQIPLARLKREEIVDQKALAALNRAAPKQERVREARRPSRAAHTAYAQAPEQEAQQPRRGLFGFSLF